MEDVKIKQMLMSFNRALVKSNQEHIASTVGDISLDDLMPVIDLVSRARAAYINHLYELCHKYKGSEKSPNAEELKRLGEFRMRFMELVEGAKALETSIERGYVDLKHR